MRIKDAVKNYLIETITSIAKKKKNVKLVGSYTSVIEDNDKSSKESYKKWLYLREVSLTKSTCYIVEHENEHKVFIKEYIDDLSVCELASIASGIRC